MVYAVAILGGLAALFLFLFIRSAIANGNLRNTNAELAKNADIKQKQLDIAANHPDTPVELADRMRTGKL